MIAMGKCGGRELNYVSDVDVLFVAEPLEGEPEEPALRTATQLAAATMRICSAHTAEGTLWPVDAGAAAGGQGRARWSAPWTATSRTTALGQDLGVPGAAQGPAGRR